MRSVKLPNGLDIYALSQSEASILYHEIFTTKAYMKHDIAIKDGDCIFDVGANIGLYSVFLAQTYQNLSIYAFEPIPDIFAVLQRNIALHSASSTIKLFPVGLSSKSGEARFEFDRFASFAASMDPQSLKASMQKDAGLTQWSIAALRDAERISKLSPAIAQTLEGALSRPLLKPVVLAGFGALLLGTELRKRLFLKKLNCSLRRTSEIIQEQNIKKIDLMKIDVEGSEMDVIVGISKEDWPKIRQLVIEVHDADGRVKEMESLLKNQGYRVILDQEDWELHKLLGIFTLYAMRP